MIGTKKFVAILGLAGFGFAGLVYAGGGLRDDPAARSGRDPKRRLAIGEFLPTQDNSIPLGQSVDGLNGKETRRFELGRQGFAMKFDAGRGLGPAYNGVSCTACHNAAAFGGASDVVVQRFGRFGLDGVTASAPKFGDSMFQEHALSESCADVRPQGAFFVVDRVTTPLFGTGLIEAISDSDILAMEDPDDADRDGVSGRAHWVYDEYTGAMRVGRFGWKAQAATLDAFSAREFVDQVGITNELFPNETSAGIAADDALDDCDTVADPEDFVDRDGFAQYERLADFARMLAPPTPAPNALRSRGARLFMQIGCTSCHAPVLYTGRTEIAALSYREVTLFSDLLLHDMSSAGDGLSEGEAGPNEMRTAPLWGLRHRPALMHDGRFTNPRTRIYDAIEAHDGEALRSRVQWQRLPQADRDEIVRFLGAI